MNTRQQLEALHDLTQESAAALIGVAPRTLRSWSDAPRNAEGRYSGPALVKWLVNRRTAEALAKIDDPGSDDPLLNTGGDSAELRRYRQARAELAELDLAQRRGELVPYDTAAHVIEIAGLVLRRANLQLRKKFGQAAVDVVIKALAEIERVLEREGEDEQ